MATQAKVAYRNFQCDKCGTIKFVQTNHKGQIYSQKCPNWSCSAGYTSMSFYNGTVGNIEAEFYESNATTKARINVNKEKYSNWLEHRWG